MLKSEVIFPDKGVLGDFGSFRWLIWAPQFRLGSCLEAFFAAFRHTSPYALVV